MPEARRLPLNTLPAFRAVAERGSVRAAALQLHLTHSAVSQQIKLLEERLGFVLFERAGQRLALNAAGQSMLAAVQQALGTLDQGVQAAEATAGGADQRLRVSTLPSFAQRWLLPRMQRWRERNPTLTLEIETSQRLVDLTREGFHAAVRQGRGHWPGVESEQLFSLPMPLIVLAAPSVLRTMADTSPAALAQQPLLGDAGWWDEWFARAGVRTRTTPVATFSDAGMMLQTAEQGLGLALAREILAADALASGRLVRLSPLSMELEGAQSYHLVFPPALRDWPPLAALRAWLREEIERSQQALQRRAARASRAARIRVEPNP